MTKDELLARGRVIEAGDADQERKRREIAKHVEEFLARGGQIKVVEPNVRTEQFKPFSISKSFVQE